MANQEVVKRARSAFKEILNEMEHPLICFGGILKLRTLLNALSAK